MLQWSLLCSCVLLFCPVPGWFLFAKYHFHGLGQIFSLKLFFQKRNFFYSEHFFVGATVCWKELTVSVGNGKGKGKVFRVYVMKACVEVDDDDGDNDDIYLLQLGIHPVAVVGSLVQK